MCINLMKKLIHICLLCLIATFSYAEIIAQELVCEVDTTVSLPEGTSAGVVPDTLADGVVGQAYEAVLQFILPSDTSIAGFSVSFCSFQLLETDPPLDSLGLEVACVDSACIFVVDHSISANRRCAVLRGTPNFPLETLDVIVVAELGVVDDDTICTPSGIDPFPFPFTFQFRVSDSTTTALDDYLLNEFDLSVFPNPANDRFTVEYTLPEAADVSIEMFDLIGRAMYQSELVKRSQGSHQNEIVFPSPSKGIYLVKVDLNKGERTFWQKVIRQ